MRQDVSVVICLHDDRRWSDIQAALRSVTQASDERHYTLRTLPAGARLGVEHFARKGDTAGLARATMIVAGLTSTRLGYVSGSLMTSRAARRRGWAQPTLLNAQPTLLSASRRPSDDRVR
jgi:hypothetical protein